MNEPEINRAANSLYSLMYGEYSKEENEFINAVLKGVKERSGGSIHISFDFSVLIKNKDKGKSVESILDETFNIMGKLESGEIKGKPYTDDVERFSFDDSRKLPKQLKKVSSDAENIICKHLSKVK